MSIQTNGNDQHVARFGHELKWLHAAETRGQVGLGLLHQHERELIQNNMLDDDREVRMKLRRKFELGMDYFLDVKNTLLLWLAMWDELLGQKCRYDREAVDSSDNEMFDSGSDESENAPDGTGDNADLTEKGQSGSDTIFVLGDVDAEGNFGSDYVARALDRRPECSSVEMRRRGLRPRGLGGNVASIIPRKRAAYQCDADAEGGRMLKR
ncbi:hypothetical protein F5883DRAFT_623393 [Diaporthe sp. PMI_573]|nr:hypothetical protein F5883DRAFT_623393 [Diaporthaceae sp. PMI_573]